MPLAVKTRSTRDVMKYRHTIPLLVLSDVPANFCYDSGGFMAVDSRRGQKVVLDLFQIRMANTTRFNSNQDFIVADRGSRNFFRSNTTVAAVYGRKHRTRGAIRALWLLLPQVRR
jgi:hypothetical protein